MENSNITKQAKSDIFKELHPIIKFYMSKGAKAVALKKYYKNNKRFEDILDDIKSKGSNLVKDDSEYRKLVRTILEEILDDIIAKEKDDTYKNKNKNMKKLKTFENFKIDEMFSYNEINLRKLETFKERLELAQTEEELKELLADVEEYSEYMMDRDESEGEYSDFKIAIERKMDEIEEAKTGIPKYIKELIDKKQIDYTKLFSDPRISDEVKDSVRKYTGKDFDTFKKSN